MENRMRNTFVVLALVALVHSIRATDTPVPVTAPTPATAPTAPTIDPTLPTLPSSSTPTNAHPEAGAKDKIVANNGSALPVQIDVFYEALCSDSVDFVQKQLTKVDEKLHKYINVSFYPFAQGNISKGADDHYIINCEREGECNADKVHACGIESIKDSEKLLKFVNCSLVEGFKNKTVPIEACGTNSNLDKDIIATIQKCAADDSSLPKLAEYSNKARENHVTFVPRIVINGKYSEETQKLSLTNLFQVVCNSIPGSDSPSECKNTGSGSSAVVVGFLPLLISVYYFIRML